MDLSPLKGAKGDPGESGPTPEFRLEKNQETASTDLWWSDGTVWRNLGPVGGRSPKLMRVFNDLNDPEHQNDTTADDRIVWGYDGDDEWVTLCYLDELRAACSCNGSSGDSNVVLGCPSSFSGGEPDHDKIWFDPCDDTSSSISAEDIV